MNIENIKIELIQWLTTLEDENALKDLISIRDKSNKDWWESISSEEKNSIQNGLKDIKEGKVVSHTEARKVYEEYL